MDTGEALKEFREKMGVPLWSMAKKVGVDESTLCRIERGSRPIPDHLPGAYRKVAAEVQAERAMTLAEVAA